MELFDLKKELSENSYPGRGIVIGQSEDGKYAAIAYFIMGRSVNSRNRVFIPEGEGLRTQAFDPSKLSDPSLIIYAPVRVLGNHTIVTNGDQTDTVYDTMKNGGTFEDALRTRTFEPDGPNFTPRISGLVTRDGSSFTYRLSILKSGDGDPEAPERFFFEYTPKAGKGHFIHTYKCDGDPIPTFTGEPERVAIPDDIRAFSEELWDNLNEANKISLYVRYTDLATGKYESVLINKNK